MSRKVLAAWLFGLVVLSPAVAADWPLDTFAPLAQTARDGAEAIAGSGQDIAAQTVELVGASAGPGSSFVASVLAATGPLGQMGSQVQAEFVALGDGRATTLQQNGTFHGACEAMHAAVEYHAPYFSENPLYFDLQAGQGSPFAVCGTGWRGALQPGEVHGDLGHGLVGHSDSIDAIIDLTLGPERADGTRALWVRQVTFPSGIADVLEFHGAVVEFV